MIVKIFSLLKKINRFSSPKIKGEIRKKEEMHNKNWFGVGGTADFYFLPESVNDLALFIRQKQKNPLTVLGAGSNCLIRDGGIKGFVIHLGKPFKKIKIKNDIIQCGAGVSLLELSKAALNAGISGFEFLSGIPGTVGGAITMNAGAFGSSISDVLKKIELVDANGAISHINVKSEYFSYRTCHLSKDFIFTGATFKGYLADKSEIKIKMDELKQKRIQNQPQGVKTCGSTFKNPTGAAAWQLIEKVGGKNLSVGGAKMSDKHLNFMINQNNASADDLEKLGDLIQQKVLQKCGIQLEWEIKKIGVKK